MQMSRGLSFLVYHAFFYNLSLVRFHICINQSILCDILLCVAKCWNVTKCWITNLSDSIVLICNESDSNLNTKVFAEVEELLLAI